MKIVIRYNPHANLAKPWHAIVQTSLKETTACTLPQECAADAEEVGDSLFELLVEKELA